MNQQRDKLNDHNTGVNDEESNTEEIGVQDCQLLTLMKQSHHDYNPQDVGNSKNNYS